MKKLIAILLIILSTNMLHTQTAMGQQPASGGKFSGGIMINPSVAWTMPNVDDPSKNNVTTKGANIGFAYGLLGEYFFNNNYGISINPRVNAFDAQFKYQPDVKSIAMVDRTLHLQYIELPITLKMRTNEVGYMKYFAQVGFMPAVKLAAKGDIDTLAGTTNMGSIKGLNVTNDVNVLMLYSVIGLGLEYNLGSTTSIVGSITWNNGFTNIWNKEDDNTNTKPYVLSNFNSPTGNISLNIGVLF